MTLVSGASKMHEAGSVTMSEDTIGSVEYLRKRPSAAFSMIALTSSTVVSRPASKVRSVAEPVGTGTRRAKPSSLPLSSGMTRPMAFAAPVVEVLVAGVGVDRRHQALDDAELVVEHLGHRGEAVRRAGGVRDDRVLG